jgi:hypothetical protein
MKTYRGTLTSTGWVHWDQITALLAGDKCLWTDLGGLHGVADVPPALPVGATHLWAWRTDRWIRVRIDSGRALATTLSPDTAASGVLVTFTKPQGIAWERHERAAECRLSVTLIRTEGPAPITFIADCTPTA